MLEVEVVAAELAADAPARAEIERLCVLAAGALGVHDGHVAIEFVDEQRIAQLNERHRGRAQATDVLSFPIDGADPDAPASAGPGDAAAPPRELGDIVICPARTADTREAIVHGMLHLLGMDHELDDGEMLALQDELLSRPAP